MPRHHLSLGTLLPRTLEVRQAGCSSKIRTRGAEYSRVPDTARSCTTRVPGSPLGPGERDSPFAGLRFNELLCCGVRSWTLTRPHRTSLTILPASCCSTHTTR